MDYERFENLQVKDYEHPGEANAFSALKKIPIIDTIMGEYLKYMNQWSALPEVQGDFFRITEKTCPTVYRIYQKALYRLDMPNEIPLYAKSEYNYNAYATGGNSPYVVVHSSNLKNFKEDELLSTLGHELGHIKSGHLIYTNLASHFNSIIARLPFDGTAIINSGIDIALMQWQRMMEFTADRAGAIAADSVEARQRVMMHYLGVNESLNNIVIKKEDLLNQNEAFEESNNNFIGRMLNSVMILGQNHPWTISRIQELENWKNSGEFNAIINKYRK